MKNIVRYGSSFIAPFVVTIVLPLTLVWFERQPNLGEWLTSNVLLLALGAGLMLAGLTLFVMTVRMFILIGRGTIMPWDPTRKLITGSLYGYVRNPMILSLLVILVGEAMVLASWWIGALAIIFWVTNTVYFKFSEEPGLEQRFGQEYVEYKENVPRWLPRTSAWKPS